MEQRNSKKSFERGHWTCWSLVVIIIKISNSTCSFDVSLLVPVRNHISFCCKYFHASNIHFCSIDVCAAAFDNLYEIFCCRNNPSNRRNYIHSHRVTPDFISDRFFFMALSRRRSIRRGKMRVQRTKPFHSILCCFDRYCLGTVTSDACK